MKTDFPYSVRRSKRRTVSVEITPKGEVLVRAPLHMSEAAVHDFIISRQAWVHTHLERWKERQAQTSEVRELTEAEREALRTRAKTVFAERVAALAPTVGAAYGSITIRFQHGRWGSCSSKGNLNFNGLLLLAPPEVLDYVVVHELCHRLELNHSDRFWREVARVMPEYAVRRSWLKTNGAALMARLPKISN